MSEPRRSSGRRPSPFTALASIAVLVLVCFARDLTAGEAAPRSPEEDARVQVGAAASSFTITFWCGPPLDALDDRRAAEIAAAGFDVIGPPCEGGYDAERNRRALDIAARHGLGMWVADHRFGRAALGTGWEYEAPRAVADYRDHPATAGYFIADEPTADEFDSIASLVGAVRGADPRRLAYVNLLPEYIKPPDLGADSYADYLERFVATVNPQLLSYDYYPFGKEKDRSTFFSNLAAVAGVSSRRRVPFMLVVLAMPHGPYRDPSEAELAWQVYHALAYGARGVSYFVYWTPPRGGDWDNRHGLIERGRRTLHYYQVARLNRGVRALADQLTPFEWRSVADSLGEIAAPLPAGPIEAIDGGAVTVGLFEGARGERAALLVNRDYRYGARVRVRLSAGAARPDLFDTESRRWLAVEESILLAPGSAHLLRWPEERGRSPASTPGPLP